MTFDVIDDPADEEAFLLAPAPGEAFQRACERAAARYPGRLGRDARPAVTSATPLDEGLTVARMRGGGQFLRVERDDWPEDAWRAIRWADLPESLVLAGAELSRDAGSALVLHATPLGTTAVCLVAGQVEWLSTDAPQGHDYHRRARHAA